MWICINMQKIRLFHWFVQEIRLIKKILQVDWLRTFWPIYQEQEFSQLWDLCRNTANNIIFIIEQIQWKLMTNFFNILNKTVFGPFLALSRTTSNGFLVLCQNSWKNNDTIPRKRPDRRKDGRTDRPYFTGPFQLMPGV